MRIPWILGAWCACSLACNIVPVRSTTQTTPKGPTTPAATGATGPAATGADAIASYEAPVATQRYVWVANPQSGRITYIDATTLQSRTTRAGRAPTYVAALKGADATAVINVGSNDASLLAIDESSGAVTSRRVKLAPGMNTWSMSPDGRWAIAWADAAKTRNAPKTKGFQDISVIDLTANADRATVLAVGYRPQRVIFDANSTHAYATTEDGITVVSLTLSGGPRISDNFPLSDDPTEAANVADVNITRDGAYAFARIVGSTDVVVVSLSNGVRTRVTLATPPSELDVLSTANAAVAVLPESEEIALIDAATPSPPTLIAVTGSKAASIALAEGAAAGVAFTNASDVEQLSVLTLTPPTSRIVRMYATVLHAFPSPDGSAAVVLHPSTAFSLLPMSTPLPAKIVAADAPLYAVTFSSASDRALVVERDDARSVFGVSLCRFPSLEVNRTPLGSPPISAGIVEQARRGYVAQAHPTGRITFVDLETGDARTITGFELAASVIDGGKP